MKEYLGLLVMPAVLAVCYLIYAVTAIVADAPFLILGLLPIVVAELAVARSNNSLLDRIGSYGFNLLARLVLLDSLLILALIRFGVPNRITAAVLLLIIGANLARVVILTGAGTRSSALQRGIRWFNLHVDDSGTGTPTGRVLVAALALAPEIVIPLGLIGIDVIHDWGALLLLALISFLSVAAFASVALLRARRPQAPNRVQNIRHALDRENIEVIAYFGGPPSSTHVINVWIEALESIPQRAVLVLRDGWHMAMLKQTKLPTLVVESPKNVEELFLAPSRSQVALYPTNINVNNHLIRIPGIFDVFIGHGDSDKAGSANPISRIYDEIWVAGQAGKDRYFTANIDINADKIKIIGRPQLMALDTDAPNRDASKFTVLYAPTWEGFYSAWSYSSLRTMGIDIISTLLSIPGVRVLYKAHPATGSVDSRLSEVDRNIERLLRNAGGPHRIVPKEEPITTTFLETDMLISDISSVVSDFLYTGRPYIVTNPDEEDTELFQRKYPSTSAAWILATKVEALGDYVSQARTDDPLVTKRRELAQHLLGPGVEERNALAGFERAIESALRTQDARNDIRLTRN